jgi:putative SOS response-associated peptidase YedK
VRTYREPFKKRRCLVTATGWYEWQKVTPKVKRPFHFSIGNRPWAFAGVWDVWSGDGKASITSFSIVTTSPAPSTAPYHDRMPSSWKRASSRSECAGARASSRDVKPYGGAIDIWEVGKDVGNVRNDKPELLDLVALIKSKAGTALACALDNDNPAGRSISAVVVL